MRAIQVHEYGGPEVLQLDDLPVPVPHAGEAQVRIATAGINFLDVNHRTGQTPLTSLPTVIGSEAAGTVEAVGPDVTDLEVGDRVGFCMRLGAYAEHVVLPAEALIRVPSHIGLDVAASSLLQGMTAHYLLKDTVPVAAGDRILVHAGAGGVGSLLIQMAKHLGAVVYTTVSTDAKAAYAKELGADVVIRYTDDDVPAAISELTAGEGVKVVYDSVGRDTFDDSLRCLRRRGHLVLFGHSSGPVENFAPQRLSGAGSVYLTRPTLRDYSATPEERRYRSGEVFGWIADGVVSVRIDERYSLDSVRHAHEALEGRQTMGKVLINISPDLR